MSKKLKHKRLRNTGLIYELLIRQLTFDVLNNNAHKSVPIIKKYFGKNSPLKQELHLYETLLNQKVKDSNFAIKIIEGVINTKGNLDTDKLSKLKYNLIKDITEAFGDDQFFRTKIDNYPVYASVCNLLEYDEKDNPNDYTKNKITVAEHLLSSKGDSKSENLLESVDPALRPMTFKLLSEKFNNKWSSLNPHQKHILRHFILNTVSNSDTKTFINEQVGLIRSGLKKAKRKVPNQVVRIKIDEVNKLLDSIENSKFVTELHYLTLIRYHELLQELKVK